MKWPASCTTCKGSTRTLPETSHCSNINANENLDCTKLRQKQAIQKTTTSKPHSSQEARVIKSSPTTLFSGATLFRTRKVLFQPGYQQRRRRAIDECFPALPITPSLSLNLVTPLLGPNSSWKMRTYGRGGQSTSPLPRNGTRPH